MASTRQTIVRSDALKGLVLTTVKDRTTVKTLVVLFDGLAILVQLGLLLILDLLGGGGAASLVAGNRVDGAVGALGRDVVVIIVIAVVDGALLALLGAGSFVGGAGSRDAAALATRGRSGAASSVAVTTGGAFDLLGMAFLELFEDTLGPLLGCEDPEGGGFVSCRMRTYRIGG